MRLVHALGVLRMYGPDLEAATALLEAAVESFSNVMAQYRRPIWTFFIVGGLASCLLPQTLYSLIGNPGLHAAPALHAALVSFMAGNLLTVYAKLLVITTFAQPDPSAGSQSLVLVAVAALAKWLFIENTLFRAHVPLGHFFLDILLVLTAAAQWRILPLHLAETMATTTTTTPITTTSSSSHRGVTARSGNGVRGSGGGGTNVSDENLALRGFGARHLNIPSRLVSGGAAPPSQFMRLDSNSISRSVKPDPKTR